MVWIAIAALTADEARLALFDESACALGVVLRGEQYLIGTRGEGGDRVERCVQAGAYRLFRVLDGQRRVCRDLRREPAPGWQQLLWLDHAINEADAQRLFCVDDIAGEEQFQRLRQAHDQRE